MSVATRAYEKAYDKMVGVGRLPASIFPLLLLKAASFRSFYRLVGSVDVQDVQDHLREGLQCGLFRITEWAIEVTSLNHPEAYVVMMSNASTP